MSLFLLILIALSVAYFIMSISFLKGYDKGYNRKKEEYKNDIEAFRTILHRDFRSPIMQSLGIIREYIKKKG